MIREEYLAVVGAYFERALFQIKDIPADRLGWPLADGKESAIELFCELTARAERMVRALELLFHGADTSELLATPLNIKHDAKRAVASYKIAHSTVAAALERIPESRLNENSEVPEWLINEYMTHIQTAATRIEDWSQSLRVRGQAGPTGLPVIQ